MKILEGATNKDIYISVKNMINRTYYEVKPSLSSLVNTILAETLAEHFESLYTEPEKVIEDLIKQLKKQL